METPRARDRKNARAQARHGRRAIQADRLERRMSRAAPRTIASEPLPFGLHGLDHGNENVAFRDDQRRKVAAWLMPMFLLLAILSPATTPQPEPVRTAAAPVAVPVVQTAPVQRSGPYSHKPARPMSRVVMTPRFSSLAIDGTDASEHSSATNDIVDAVAASSVAITPAEVAPAVASVIVTRADPLLELPIAEPPFEMALATPATEPMARLIEPDTSTADIGTTALPLEVRRSLDESLLSPRASDRAPVDDNAAFVCAAPTFAKSSTQARTARPLQTGTLPIATDPLVSRTRTQDFGGDRPALGLQISEAALAQTNELVVYRAAYTRIAFPMGDVSPMFGVCTDVVIRALREVGIDLQEQVQRTRAGNGDANIDHRRVDTLKRYFALHGETAPISEFAEDYQPGDIVTYFRPWNRSTTTHIAIVSHIIAPSGRPMIVHNRGWGAQLEDALLVDKITGHYRVTASTPVDVSVTRTPARKVAAQALSAGVRRMPALATLAKRSGS
jgi:uncharacterized protein YijF (DUF1287 family)